MSSWPYIRLARMYIDFSLQQMYHDDCDEALAVSLPCQCVIFSFTVSSEYLWRSDYY